MAKYYKLIDAMTESATFNLPYVKDGIKVYKFYTLRPGKKYEEHVDDEVFMEAILDAHKKIMYTPEKEKLLKNTGARYEVVTCKSCGGRVKKIDLWLVEAV